MFNADVARWQGRIEGAGMKLPAWIGIDPGASGAIAVIYESGNVCWIKNDSTEHELADWVRDVAGTFDCSAVIEQVNAMPKQGVSSTFKFGKSFGFLIGILTALQVPYESYRPQTWQKHMRCLTKGDKNVSKAAAQRLWPSTKITHANADALLIAEFCRQIRAGR
jgi:Holliday junction resolvasome RuvABC endonuclease subunit